MGDGLLLKQSSPKWLAWTSLYSLQAAQQFGRVFPGGSVHLNLFQSALLVWSSSLCNLFCLSDSAVFIVYFWEGGASESGQFQGLLGTILSCLLSVLWSLFWMECFDLGRQCYTTSNLWYFDDENEALKPIQLPGLPFPWKRVIKICPLDNHREERADWRDIGVLLREESVRQTLLPLYSLKY